MRRFTVADFAVLLVCIALLSNGVFADSNSPISNSEQSQNEVQCGENEVPISCVECIPTCNRPEPENCEEPGCEPGCACEEGLFKGREGDCLEFFDCLAENKRYNEAEKQQS